MPAAINITPRRIIPANIKNRLLGFYTQPNMDALYTGIASSEPTSGIALIPE